MKIRGDRIREAQIYHDDGEGEGGDIIPLDIYSTPKALPEEVGRINTSGAVRESRGRVRLGWGRV